MTSPKAVVIGWKETIDLPEWGIQSILAKSDTGARRSALDVRNIKELPDRKVQFDIVLDRKDRTRIRTVVAPIDHQTHVRSSNGQQHERYFVRTKAVIHGREKEIEFSLVSRASMVCRVLLGRKALEGDSLLCYGSQIALSTFLPERMTRKKRRKLKKIQTEVEES